VLWLLVLCDGAESGAKGQEGEGIEVRTVSRGGAGGCDDVASIVEVVAAVGGGVGVDDASSVAFGAAAIGADGAVGIDDVGCLVGFAVVIVGIGVEGVGSVGDASRAVGVGVVAASVAICSSGVVGHRWCR